MRKDISVPLRERRDFLKGVAAFGLWIAVASLPAAQA